MRKTSVFLNIIKINFFESIFLQQVTSLSLTRSLSRNMLWISAHIHHHSVCCPFYDPICKLSLTLRKNIENIQVQYPVSHGSTWTCWPISYQCSHLIKCFPVIGSNFYTPWEHQKASDFLTFSGGIEIADYRKAFYEMRAMVRNGLAAKSNFLSCFKIRIWEHKVFQTFNLKSFVKTHQHGYT